MERDERGNKEVHFGNARGRNRSVGAAGMVKAESDIVGIVTRDIETHRIRSGWGTFVDLSTIPLDSVWFCQVRGVLDLHYGGSIRSVKDMGCHR
jgi:hypothetical protein